MDNTIPLYDSAGTQYAVPQDYLLNPPSTTGPTRQLWDATGRAYDLPADLFADDEPATPTALATPSLPRSMPPNERQLQVFLETTGLPQDLQDTFWALTHQLALTKISSPEDFRLAKLRLENLIRLCMIEGLFDDKTSLLAIEQLEFWAGEIELRRSITYDGKPNERELWTIQGVHQKVEQVASATPINGGGGSILSNLFRAIKGGR